MGELLTGIGTVLAGLGSLGGLAAWRRSKRIDSVVQGNGHGSVDKMLERLLDQQASTHRLLVDHLTDRSQHLN